MTKRTKFPSVQIVLKLSNKIAPEATPLAHLHAVAALHTPTPPRGLLAARSLFDSDLRFVDQTLASDTEVGASPGREAAAHLVNSGGKRVRALSVLLSASLFGEVTPAARQLAVVAEMVHAATLLHDDVIDDSDTRRGAPTSRKVFGNAVSILAGDLLLTHALHRAAEASALALSDLITTLRRLVDGEIVQLRGRTQLDLSVATYEHVINGKTSSLFGWATRAGAISQNASDEVVRLLGVFGEQLGAAFQLVDDVLDYEGDPRETGKNLLGDLSEGKLTLPLLLAIEQQPSLLELVHLVRSGDGAAAQQLAQQVRHSSACSQVRARAKQSAHTAVQALSILPPSTSKDLLCAVAVELTSRVA